MKKSKLLVMGLIVASLLASAFAEAQPSTATRAEMDQEIANTRILTEQGCVDAKELRFMLETKITDLAAASEQLEKAKADNSSVAIFESVASIGKISGAAVSVVAGYKVSRNLVKGAAGRELAKRWAILGSKLGALAGTTWAAGRIGAELTNNEIEDIQRKVSQIKTDLKTLRDLQDFVCN